MQGGLEDLSMAIVLEPKEPYFYETRGDLYVKLGKQDLAVADFKKVVELEDVPEKYECIPYAYQGLGMNDGTFIISRILFGSPDITLQI